MPCYCSYLVSSLPVLSLDSDAPFSYERFLEKCAQLVDARDYRVLSLLPDGVPDQSVTSSSVVRGWLQAEIRLRNEMVRMRAQRLGWDAARFQRANGYAGPDITHLILHARRSPNPLEGQRVIDQWRWSVLDDLSGGHYLDREALMAYALRLLIVLRWQAIRQADTAAYLRQAVDAVPAPQ